MEESIPPWCFCYAGKSQWRIFLEFKPSKICDSTTLSQDSNTGMKDALGFCPTYHPNFINSRPAWLSGCTQARVYG